MSESIKTTDNELLLQIVGYNSEAFEQLYNRYSATVYSLIKEIVTNPKLAEKILLNVFSVFLKRIDYFSTEGNDIFTCFTLLARNISIDSLKRMKFVEGIPEYSDKYEVEFILPNISKVINPINFDERNALGEKIKAYKNHLTEVQNLVLSLVYFEGLDEEEIAKRLSVPSATVRQKILSIVDSLYQQYTGKNGDSNNDKKVSPLIKLEALGCLSSEERILLNNFRKNDPDFLWKELGEYQNLTALISTAIPIENPGHELQNEIKNIFIKISGGGEIDYKIVAPEPIVVSQVEKPKLEPVKQKIENSIKEIVQKPILNEISNHAPKPIPESVQQKIQNSIPETNKQPEIKEKKKPEFELKFRERDPEELSLLRKLERDELNKKTSNTLLKTNSDVKLKDHNPPLNKPNVFSDKNPVVSSEKKSTPAAPIMETGINNKTTAATENKTELKIDNDDPSIVIDQPKTLTNIEEVVVKNRLIPNSSINLKELFKKDTEPVLNKENTTVNLKEETKAERKPITQVVEKSEIKIKTNEPTKEFTTANVFIDKLEKIIENKPADPAREELSLENKSTEPAKENRVTNTIAAKEEKNVEIKIKSNESPQELRRSNVFVDKNQKGTPAKQPVLVAKKHELESKKEEPVKEIQKKNVVEEKADILKSAAQISLNPNEKIKSQVKVDENLSNLKKPAVERSNLKIRETVFTENEEKPEIINDRIKSRVAISKSEIKKTETPDKLTKEINIDEILSKIDDEKPSSALSETESYEKEIVSLNKKVRKNILAFAAMFVIVVSASVFVYLQFQEAPVKAANKINNPEKINLAGQTNLVLNNENVPEVETENTVKETESVNTEKPLVKQPAVIPPLPEISIKEESTLFASNVNEGLMNDLNTETHQTAAAKTETVVPPKENKVVDEEPAFFVAVEEMPELIGGLKGLQSKIIYPEIAKRVGIEGKVVVQALVDEAGNVISVGTLKGIGSGCDEVAMDAVRNSKFIPGKQRGKNVKVQVNIPIIFKK
ncbi:MAG TPA: TonB family protein [Ignavibacteriaceae bacterium]